MRDASKAISHIIHISFLLVICDACGCMCARENALMLGHPIFSLLSFIFFHFASNSVKLAYFFRLLFPEPISTATVSSFIIMISILIFPSVAGLFSFFFFVLLSSSFLSVGRCSLSKWGSLHCFFAALTFLFLSTPCTLHGYPVVGRREMTHNGVMMTRGANEQTNRVMVSHWHVAKVL